MANPEDPKGKNRFKDLELSCEKRPAALTTLNNPAFPHSDFADHKSHWNFLNAAVSLRHSLCEFCRLAGSKYFLQERAF